MGQVINTNTLSLLTQNNLSKSQSALNTSIQRLSSGMRINSAKDDAAGQAIANRFTASIRGLTQAQRNANDGISLAQTTEGALNEVNNNLQRIRELTVQSANGSNSGADKASIQAEITQRLSEIDRTSKQTDFNGVKVLSAAAVSLSIQVGSQDGEAVTIGLSEISSSTLGMTDFNVAGASSDYAAASSDYAAATAGTKAIAGGLTLTSVATGTASNYTVDYVDAVGAPSAAFSGTTLTITADFTNTAVSAATMKTALAAVSASVTVSGTATGNFNVLGAAPADTALAGGAAIVGTAQVGTPGAAGAGANTVDPLKAIDAALAKVDEQRGSLGAVQNRFDSIISNLGTTINNLTSSRSRIEDADYATEVSNMTRAQILQQAGTSVLAKANQSTQGVMALLQ
ncbi:MAG: FliC/FljB family flagellin [Rhodoferax sp.]|nr:FliC/FljB family flagellin [Rhodoferax sp.]